MRNLQEERFSIGFWANTKTATKTHITKSYKTPICGSRVGEDKSFQWCSNHFLIEYLECEHCKKIQKGVMVNV